MKTPATTIRIPPDIKAKIEAHAARMGISLTAYLTIAGLEKLAKPPHEISSKKTARKKKA